MKRPLYYSILLHASILILAIFGLPFFSRNDINQDFAMVIDVVPISELTNVKVKTSDRKDDESTKTKKAPQAVEKEEDKKEDKKDEKKPEPAKKEEAKKQDLEAEKIPDKKVKEEKKKEEKKQEPKKEKKEEKKDKAKEDKKKKKPKDDSFEKSILKSLDADAKKKDDAKVDKEFKDLSDALKGDTNKAYNDAAPMSMSEIDAIKSQIVKNWNTSSFAGASDAAGMQVLVVIELDMNANVVNVKPKPQSNGSPYYGVFVESAVRAVKMSSPLQNLPQDKFHRWKEIEFKFDSTGMIY